MLPNSSFLVFSSLTELKWLGGLSNRQQCSKTLYHTVRSFLFVGRINQSLGHIYMNMSAADQKNLMNAYYIPCELNW